MRWAIFKDDRGVPYCEPVDQGLAIFSKEIPAQSEQRNMITRKVKRKARPAETLYHIKFSERHYNRADFLPSAFENPPEDFKPCDDRVYMLENLWGPRQVLLFIEDDKLGRRLQYEFRRLVPEGDLYKLKSVHSMNADKHDDERLDRIIEGLREVLENQ